MVTPIKTRLEEALDRMERHLSELQVMFDRMVGDWEQPTLTPAVTPADIQRKAAQAYAAARPVIEAGKNESAIHDALDRIEAVLERLEHHFDELDDQAPGRTRRVVR